MDNDPVLLGQLAVAILETLGLTPKGAEPMPLVFTQNDVSVAELDYADVLGEVYEYPARYRTLIQPGERFVYYRGRRRADGSSQTPSYFGCGTVGEITEIGERLRCKVVDYQAFKRPVPFRAGDFYREPEANERKAIGFYYQVGVRSIDERSFDEICEIGLDRPVIKKPAVTKGGKPGNAAKSTSAKPPSDSDKAIHDMAMALATFEAKEQWPDATIFRAPAGQQFSLAARLPTGTTKHIAVRATAESKPLVRLTVSDVSYSNTHSNSYSLWVFYDVDLERRTAKFLSHDGSITGRDIDLEAALHGGQLQTDKAGKKVGPIRG